MSLTVLCLSPQSHFPLCWVPPMQVRQTCRDMARTKTMENAVLLMILGNCITLVMFDSEDRNCLNPACKKLKVRLAECLIAQLRSNCASIWYLFFCAKPFLTSHWYNTFSFVVAFFFCLQILSDLYLCLQTFEILFSGMALIECIIRITGDGFRFYWRDNWNRMDFIIVCCGIIDFFPGIESGALSALRTTRVLRPLRVVNRFPSVLDVV